MASELRTHIFTIALDGIGREAAKLKTDIGNDDLSTVEVFDDALAALVEARNAFCQANCVTVEDAALSFHTSDAQKEATDE